MTIAAGETLGSYRILELIGSGGQGEVYRAHDSTLKRDVAIKVLPEVLAAETDRVSRFQREAELLASLSHSNIAVVHNFQEAAGRQFLVMEFVEGETLADRLKRSPLPVDETLHVAKQVAEALEAAHQKGITHRDLKPANIKITTDGKVKVLDFGLAKMFESTAPVDASNSPTLMSGTAGGVILGTAAYMSPEQARGKMVDKRTDIWALGCVIYECLTGKQAFAGDNISDTIAAIIRGEPDWAALPTETPRRLRDLLQRCLEKNPHQRLHDAADVRIAIEDAAKPEALAVAAMPRSKTFPLAAVALAVLLTASLSSAFWWIRGRSINTAPIPMHLSLQLAPGAASTANLLTQRDQFAISADGQWIVYNAEKGAIYSLFLQGIRESAGRFITGTDGATMPFFSPDGQWIAFASGKTLKKVPVTGGSPVAICDLSASVTGFGFNSGTWGTDDRIVFVPAFNAGIWWVSANGGKPELLLKTDESKDRIAYTYPQVLPQRKGILFTLSSGHAITSEDQQTAILEPNATEPRVVIQGAAVARYLPTGHIIYSHRGALLAVPFDLSRLAVTGTPTSVIEGIEINQIGGSRYSVSDNGSLVYEPRGTINAGNRLVAIDRRGSVRPITDGHGWPFELSVAPRGVQVAARVSAVNDDVWLYDVNDGTPLRLTFEPGDEIFPQWAPDGRRIAFGTRRLAGCFGNPQMEPDSERSSRVATTRVIRVQSHPTAGRWPSSKCIRPRRVTSG